MRSLLRPATVLLLCAAAIAPAAADLGEIVKIEGDVAVVRQYALAGLPAGTIVTVQRVLHNRRVSCRGSVVSTEAASSTVRVRLEGPRLSLAPNDAVHLIVLHAGPPAPAPAAAERGLSPAGRRPTPAGSPAAGASELHLPMEFPLGRITHPRR